MYMRYQSIIQQSPYPQEKKLQRPARHTEPGIIEKENDEGEESRMLNIKVIMMRERRETEENWITRLNINRTMRMRCSQRPIVLYI